MRRNLLLGILLIVTIFTVFTITSSSARDNKTNLNEKTGPTFWELTPVNFRDRMNSIYGNKLISVNGEIPTIKNKTKLKNRYQKLSSMMKSEDSEPSDFEKGFIKKFFEPKESVVTLSVQTPGYFHIGINGSLDSQESAKIKEFINNWIKKKKLGIKNPIIVFYESNPQYYSITVTGGKRANLNNSNNWATTGYAAETDKGKTGWATAGHVTKNLGNDYYNSGKYIGTSIKTNFYDLSVTADAGFVNYTNLATEIKWPDHRNVITKYSELQDTGTFIRKSGARTGITYGEVKGISATIKIEDRYLYDTTVSNVKAKGGDSGAPVFTAKYDGTGIKNWHVNLRGVIYGGDVFN